MHWMQSAIPPAWSDWSKIEAWAGLRVRSSRSPFQAVQDSSKRSSPNRGGFSLPFMQSQSLKTRG